MTSGVIQIAVIGYGAMARSLIELLSRADDGVRVGGVLLRDESMEQIPANLVRFRSIQELVAASPGLVVECASHAAVRELVPSILAAGIDVVVASIGAFGSPATRSAIEAAARQGGARVATVSGAIGGLDVLRAARLAGLDEVTYSGRKPPAAWKNTPAEALLDLDALTASTVFFDGNATDAAALYPKNANVTAAVALAGIGFARTRVRLYADPFANGNSHELEARGVIGRCRIELCNKPLPDNPKTSWLAVLSVAEAVLRHFQPAEPSGYACD